MSERYQKLFSLPGSLYTEGAPLLLTAGALLKDQQTGRVLVQLKFQSLSPKKLRAVKVAIAAFDVSGKALAGVAEYQYLDLSVKRDEEFGSKQAIPLPDAVTRTFRAECTDVIFADGSAWHAPEAAVWEPLPERQKLETGLGELAAQYRRDTLKAAQFVPAEHKDLWFCACGARNRREEAACPVCQSKKAALLEALDPKRLSAHKAEFDRAEAEKEALLEQQRQEQWAAKKAKTKKVALIATPIVCVVVAFVILLTTVIIPYMKYDDKYNDAVSLMEGGQYDEAIAAFETLDGYKDSTEKIDACYTAIQDGKYNNAVALMEQGNVVEAYEALIAMDGYKDSAERANSIRISYETEKLKTAKVGDYVIFGEYEQDNDTSNGKEAIEWLVLEKQGTSLFVISRYALDCQKYNTSYIDITWGTCSLRKWLNGTFLNDAFSAEEQASIATTNVGADKNPKYSTDPGNATNDKVFLLSIAEGEKYFSSDSARACAPTEYAIANGVYVDSDNGNCYWWLRSPGFHQEVAAYVSSGGAVDYYGYSSGVAIGNVRPALWINLDS